MKPPVLDIRHLSARAARAPAGTPPILDDVSFTVGAGQIHALVGESGSGKTITSRAILRLLPPGTEVTGGRILFAGTDVLSLPASAMLDIRGARIGLVFQEPMTSLNPALTIGRQLTEALRRHEGLDAATARARVTDMLERLEIPAAGESLGKYPHQFSGGMRQRILLAGVLALKPDLLIADEPTTALDVLIQRRVLDLMVAAVRDIGSAVLLITHDLAVVAEYAETIGIMRRGKMVEQGRVGDILKQQKHPYTRNLLAATPQRAGASVEAAGEPLLRVVDLSVDYAGRRPLPWSPAPAVRVVDKASLTVHRGETVAVVGQSGSGKTTLAKAVLRLIPSAAGRIVFGGRDITHMRADALRAVRREFQMVFQDPYSALDPRMRVGAIVLEGLRHEGCPKVDARRRMRQVLIDVGLTPDHAERFPHQLSGGQRQRVNIARALIANPSFIVADEPVSALDVTVQADILALLERLRDERGFACLFISHDLAVVERIADRVVVFHRGRIVEQGPRDRIFDHPRHAYTRDLLSAAPRLVAEDGRYRLIEKGWKP